MTLREDVLNAIPAPAREGVLKMALDHNITDPNDPTWGMVALAWSATTAAASGRETLDKALAAAARIPDAIYNSTIKAGADLKAGVAKGIEDKTAEAGAALMQAIGIAASRGAGELQKAAAGLDKLGAEKGAAFVEQWKETLAATVQKQATTALKKATLREWVAAVFGLGVMLCVGAALAVGYGMTTHKIVDARGIEVRGRGVNTEIIIRRRMVWLHHKYCPPGAACLVTPESSQP